MKSLSVVSLLASVAFAQTPSSSAASPLIPSGISSGCQSFLTSFNKDTSLNSCTGPLISAASAFGPGGSSTVSPSKDTVTSSLNTLCGSSTSNCNENVVRGKLADFYSACSAELTSDRKEDVLRTYDVLYALTPLKNAVCTKNDAGAFCVQQASLPGSSSVSASGLSNALVNTGDDADIQKYLYQDAQLSRRAPVAALVPNTTTYAASNLAFLFLQPSDSSEVLCTSCTRNILTAYINFESSVPYAPGLDSSPMLSGQKALYDAIIEKCGKNFLGGAVQAAGSLAGNGPLSGGKNAAMKSVGSTGVASFAVALSVVAGAFAFL
ncbi:hypothetical protein HGRIS_006863 [Hohenbuehelia grisea]|uniref:DUF7729 domain-containing protein n=1 Tax=Hohenbuehelia grisea TaxID=104357 RepID=A0ABR3JA86_9AGAR